MVKGNFPKKRKSVIYDEVKLTGKIFFGHILGYLALYFSAKNQKKLMKQFCTKSKNPIFRWFLDQICPKIIFFENRAPSHFGHCHFASLCQKSEKTNEPIPRKAGNRKMVKDNEKKYSRKSFFDHILGYLALYLSAKNQKKLMKQFCTKSKNPILRQFWAKFSPQIFFFQKSGSVTFWALSFCTLGPKRKVISD